MAEPPARTNPTPRRGEGRPGEQRTLDGQPVADVATPARDSDEKSGSGVLKFFGLELGIFATAVILGVVFLVAIIFFATTR